MLNRLRSILSEPKVLALGAVALLFGLPLIYVVQPLLGSVSRRPAPFVDPKQLKRDVVHLTSASRVYNDRSGLDEVAAWIHGRLEAAGARVQDQVYGVQGEAYRNVVADFGPASGPVVVIGAHYDTCGAYPGADDNASGVAGLLALAHLFQEHPPSITVELVAYTLEEPPFFRSPDMGSARHAQALKRSGREVRGVLILEMIGTFTDAPASQDYPLPGLSLIYGSHGDYLAVVGEVGRARFTRRVKAAMRGACEMPIRSINAPSAIPGIDFSDHRSYWAEGIPAVMLTDTAFFRNPRYHTRADTPDRLDYARMAEVVRGTYGAIQAHSL